MFHAGVCIVLVCALRWCVQATPAAPANISPEVIDALTKRTQDGGTEVVTAKAGKVRTTGWGHRTALDWQVNCIVYLSTVFLSQVHLSMAYTAPLFGELCCNMLDPCTRLLAICCVVPARQQRAVFYTPPHTHTYSLTSYAGWTFVSSLSTCTYMSAAAGLCHPVHGMPRNPVW
jgi:hypothetical protein